MTVVTLRPNGTTHDGGLPLTGAATPHAALSDDSTLSFIANDTTVKYDTVSLDDLSLPAGAVIKSVALRAKVARNSGVNNRIEFELRSPATTPIIKSRMLPVTWGSATTVTVFQYPPSAFSPSGSDDALVDAMVVLIEPFEGYSGGGGVANLTRIYEVYLDVTYVVQPVVDATAPTGTVTTENRPTVAWADTLDPDGGAQTAFEVKVFNDAQYTAGGFDVGTTVPVAESGATAGSDTSWAVNASLPDDNYRAYVRVAQIVNGVEVWSGWDYASFTTAVALPGVPTMTLTPEPDYGRIRIDLVHTAGAATTDGYQIQRSDDGGDTWHNIRTLVGLGEVDGADVTAWDMEAENGLTVRYRARAGHVYSGTPATSDWTENSTSWESGDQWLKHPTRPDLNMLVTIHAYPGEQRGVRQGDFQPLGRPDTIIVSDTRAPAKGTVTFRLTPSRQVALDELLDSRVPLLLQPAATDRRADRWVAFGQLDRAPLVDKAWIDEALDTLDWTEVARPDGNLVDWPPLFPALDLFPARDLFPAGA